MENTTTTTTPSAPPLPPTEANADLLQNNENNNIPTAAAAAVIQINKSSNTNNTVKSIEEADAVVAEEAAAAASSSTDTNNEHHHYFYWRYLFSLFIMTIISFVLLQIYINFASANTFDPATLPGIFCCLMATQIFFHLFYQLLREPIQQPQKSGTPFVTITMALLLFLVCYFGSTISILRNQLTLSPSSTTTTTNHNTPPLPFFKIVMEMSKTAVVQNLLIYYLQTFGYFVLFFVARRMMMMIDDDNDNDDDAQQKKKMMMMMTMKREPRVVLKLLGLCGIYLACFVNVIPFLVINLQQGFTGELGDSFGSEMHLFMNMLFNRLGYTDILQLYIYNALSSNCGGSGG